ncbi:hypothetical protein BDN72DRAFT_836473 [Pluteus cervinus]|uniref:Uncharacterized protein n=1 Tax=Pluteus cervinus TaxID=181527 RepID=A0ACD3B2K5_9AGAR|nr:hypothetical protein BDN72DRAFT_836473 [Pluteus cervinus]
MALYFISWFYTQHSPLNRFSFPFCRVHEPLVRNLNSRTIPPIVLVFIHTASILYCICGRHIAFVRSQEQ